MDGSWKVLVQGIYRISILGIVLLLLGRYLLFGHLDTGALAASTKWDRFLLPKPHGLARTSESDSMHSFLGTSLLLLNCFGWSGSRRVFEAIAVCGPHIVA